MFCYLYLDYLKRIKEFDTPTFCINSPLKLWSCISFIYCWKNLLLLVFLNRETCEEYARELELLAHKLLRLILLSLGLSDADALKGYFNDEQTSLVRLNRYPPCPSPDLVLGVGRHKDSGALTILAQDAVGGLQVRRKSDGEWIPVKPIPNAYIINIGDVVQVCCILLII